MNILILNWRDPKNPFAGGAEKLNLEILKPFVNQGDSVIWYAQSVRGLPKHEVYNGIKIIRFGNVLTNFWAWPFFYWSKKFGKVDFIIDSIHGIGYLSSVFAPNVRKIILICEIAQNIWDEMYPFPINIIGKNWEKIMIWFYKENKFWTISESTKNDLVNFGIKPNNIRVLPMGFSAITLSKMPGKYKNPTALFVGRLTEMKGIKDAILAIAEINKNSTNKWNLKIMGRGDAHYEKELRYLVKRLRVVRFIEFLGFVNEHDKFKEMSRAWVLLVPSSREGWGMIVGEANYVGTLAIGYNSPGLRDSLPYYSPSNMIVDRNYNGIIEELKKIKKPIGIDNHIIPGWEKLHKEVIKDIKDEKNSVQ